MFNPNNCCLITKNYEGKLTIFTKKQFKLKSKQRPELREKDILERIKKTVENPTFIYEDYTKSKKRVAYYLYEYKINGIVKYMKVMINRCSNYLFIITAYRPNYVKERDKTKLLYGEDNE
jgi:hypothetical protein